MDYKGYEIEIVRDEYAENPWESWDCEPPVIVKSYGRIKSYGGNVVCPVLTRQQIKDNLVDIINLCECTSLLELARRYYDGYTIVDAVNCAIDDYWRDDIDTMAVILSFAGIPNYSGSTQGCSQGDYADVLVVATDEWIKSVGCEPDTIPKQLEYAVKLFGYWAWGDVYGYDIPEIEESCFGFYGDDYEKSGLLDAARDSIDWHIDNENKRHQKQVKLWIKNSVPLECRK